MRQSLVMGNWKMNGSVQTIQALLRDIRDHFPTHAPTTAVFPPAIYLPLVADLLKGSPMTWGAQTTFAKDAGAFTGEISTTMYKDYGCRYVLVGHSERRQLFHESEKIVAEKFHHVKEHDMIPVLCVGETLSEREQGLTEHVLTQQIRAILKDNSSEFKNCVLAYEPVWAIGTGKTAAPEEAQAAHAFIRGLVSETNKTDAEDVPIIYGGSVNGSNAQALFSMPDVDGGLVGGASLDAKTFLDIVSCIKYY
ncbi:MAG: triose-phosphate isomerase [Legionellaceae bacterium]